MKEVNDQSRKGEQPHRPEGQGQQLCAVRKKQGVGGERGKAVGRLSRKREGSQEGSEGKEQ